MPRQSRDVSRSESKARNSTNKYKLEKTESKARNSTNNYKLEKKEKQTGTYQEGQTGIHREQLRRKEKGEEYWTNSCDQIKN